MQLNRLNTETLNSVLREPATFEEMVRKCSTLFVLAESSTELQKLIQSWSDSLHISFEDARGIFLWGLHIGHEAAQAQAEADQLERLFQNE